MSKSDYIKIPTDYLTRLDGLSDSELGRLVRAALRYKAQGDLPGSLGGEKLAFAELRREIDRETDISKKRSAAGKLGAGARWQEDGKSEICHPDDGKSEICHGNDSKNEFCHENDGKSEVCHPASVEDIPTGDIDNINNIYINNNTTSDGISISLPPTPIDDISNTLGLSPPIVPPKGGRRVAALPAFFEAFWQEYPRKAAKQAAIRAWRKLAPDQALADTIIAAVRRMKKSSQWTRAGGQYIPYPATFLNGERWLDEEAQAAPQGVHPRFAHLAQLYEKYKAEEEGQHDPE